MGLAILMCGEKAVRLPHRGANKAQRFLRRIAPLMPTKDATSMCHRLDHQRIPAGENFFVPSGPDARRARSQQFAARTCQQLFGLRKPQPKRLRHLGQTGGRRSSARTHPRSWRADPVRNAAEKPATLPHSAKRFNLGRRPHVKLSFVSFGVGIERRVVTARRAIAFRALPTRAVSSAQRIFANVAFCPSFSATSHASVSKRSNGPLS